MEIPILFEDNALLAVSKPADVLSEDGGMPELLQAQTGCKRIFCVHRLDRAVGGVMVYAKDGKTAAKLSELISSRSVGKEYFAVVQGVPGEPSGVLRDLLFHDSAKNKTFVVSRLRRGVKEAELEYSVVQSVETESGVLSLLRITLHTGRSHQIRAQFAARKLPLAGDVRYGSTLRSCEIALQSHRLTLPHPDTGRALEFTVPLPDTWPWTLFDPADLL